MGAAVDGHHWLGWAGYSVAATLPVLWEEQHDGLWSGLTDTYVRVYSRDEHLSANTITPVRLVELCDDGMLGIC